MLAVEVEFLHRTVRAAPREDLALTGQLGSAKTEWPISPARLYQAMVAADGSGHRCHVTGGPIGLELLESPPTIRAEVPDREAETTLHPRFVVVDKAAEGTVQEYPGRLAQQVRPGARLSLRVPLAAYVWPDAVASEQELQALRLRAARIGYLGCADSPVRVRVGDRPSAAVAALPAWEPDAAAGNEAISVAYPGFLEELDAAFDEWTMGVPRRRTWLTTNQVWYRPPARQRERVAAGRALWLRFRRPVNGRWVVAVAETLRAAVLERYQRDVAGSREQVPAVLHGHQQDLAAKGYEHVRWLPLPDVGHRHADGRIRGAAIWLPPGTDSQLVEDLKQVTSAIDQLVCPGVFDVPVRPFDGTQAPWASHPRRWSGPSRRWVTAFPAVHERFTHRDLGLGDIAGWCEHAGLPKPVRVRAARVPLLPGGVALPPQLARRTGEERRPFSHVAVEFADPVPGPVVLGRGRHFGLGLCAPWDEGDPK
jgi:CRISPR-associated protein Csb2